MQEQTKVKKQTIEGEVVSDKADKTIVVKVDNIKTHSKYFKKYKVTKKYKAHDPENVYKVGDILQIEEMNPLSRTKRWKVVKKIK